MPKLPTFTAERGALPISGGRRMETPGDAIGGLGRTLTKAADALVSGVEEQESRKALVAASEIRAKYARALDEAELSGADTEKLKEQMQNEMAQVGDDFQTTRGHETLALHSANSELGFDAQANRLRVQRADAEARLQGSQFLRSEGELMRSDPGYIKVAEKNAEAFGATLKNIPPENRALIVDGLKKSLNMASAVSAARIDPEAAKRRLEAGDWDLTPEQRETAVGKADSEIRAKRAEEAYARSVKEHEERERDDAARDKHFAAIIGGSGSRRAIMDDADLRPATREHLIDYMEARAKEAATTVKRSNPQVMRDLWLRIHAPEDDPKRIFNGDPIFEAVKAGHLNTTDANQLNALVAGQKDDNNRTFGVRLQGRISTVAAAMRAAPLYQAQPELAAAIQLELTAQVEKRAAALRQENKDPSVLLDPEHKDYYFKPGLIKSVADDVQQRAQAALPSAVVVSTQEEYDALPDGAVYVDSTGTQAVKRGKQKAPAAAPAPSQPREETAQQRREREMREDYDRKQNKPRAVPDELRMMNENIERTRLRSDA